MAAPASDFQGGCGAAINRVRLMTAMRCSSPDQGDRFAVAGLDAARLRVRPSAVLAAPRPALAGTDS